MSDESEREEMQRGADRIATMLDDLVALTVHSVDLELDGEVADALRVLHDHGHGEGLELVRDEDGNLPFDEDDIRDAAVSALDEFGLDFYLTGEKRGEEWESTGWVLVVGTGGPHYELRSDGYVHGWGWFGAHKVQASVDWSVVNYFEQIAEAYE